MTPDLERVARAICGCDKLSSPGEEQCAGCFVMVNRARAAVVALMEPSKAMVGAAECALSDWRKTLDRDEAMMRSYKPNHQRKFIASATPEEKHKIRFQAMLRAVLGDEQEGAGT